MHYTRGNRIHGEDLLEVSRKAWEVMKTHNLTGHQIVVRGVSGLVVGSVLACKAETNMLVVRKDEKSHSSRKVEGFDEGDPYLFVDDFTSGGATIDAMLTELGADPADVTVMLYDQQEEPNWAREALLYREMLSECEPLTRTHDDTLMRMHRAERLAKCTWICCGCNW